LAFDDAETAHVIQHYVAALFVSLFRLGCAETGSARISLRPHPVAGLDFILSWFGDSVLRATQSTLVLSVPSALAQSPLDLAHISAAPVHSTDRPRLRSDGTLTESVRHLVCSMLGSETPTVDRVVGYAGVSRRSLQRRLSDEGDVVHGHPRRSAARPRQGEGRTRRRCVGNSVVGPRLCPTGEPVARLTTLDRRPAQPVRTVLSEGHLAKLPLEQ
jgi:hypothetical protein